MIYACYINVKGHGRAPDFSSLLQTIVGKLINGCVGWLLADWSNLHIHICTPGHQYGGEMILASTDNGQHALTPCYTLFK